MLSRKQKLVHNAKKSLIGNGLRMVTGNLPATGGTIRRHRMGKDTPAHGAAGESGPKRVEGWAVLIAAAVGAFSIGFLSPMITLLG